MFTQDTADIHGLDQEERVNKIKLFCRCPTSGTDEDEVTDAIFRISHCEQRRNTPTTCEQMSKM